MPVKKILLLASVFLLIACNQQLAKVELVHDDVDMQATFTKTKIKKHGSIEKLFLYGHLDADGIAKEIKSIDIACFTAVANGIESESVYVDSIASYPFTKILSVEGKVAVDVYWVFPYEKHLTFDDNSLVELKINDMHSSNGACFEF